MFSTRVSLKWANEQASEPTSTYVITSPGAHFVDIRILASAYPYNPTKGDATYEEVFDWVSSGMEQVVEGADETGETVEIKFKLEIDSMEVTEAIKTGKPIEDCRRGTDSGIFSEIPGSEDRKEIGNMVNPAIGQNQDYIEIWRSLDPEKHTPTTEVREDATAKGISSYVLVCDSEHWEGKVVRLGNWVQGLIHSKQSHELHVVRAWFNGSEWEYLIRFGDVELFDLDFSGTKGNVTEKKGLKWECIEYSS
ncbi:hypothetical protein CLIB1423_15S01552 [[Candida] railenensis]|uniref:Protein HRI1 n=1 Tax=[Candida] railenensis TaxID=45579 RepID=A0A9P0QSM3_9ASCO|nr:hypothetical protein CLIB1423_15S01552 [[Candida] railenensis]